MDQARFNMSTSSPSLKFKMQLKVYIGFGSSIVSLGFTLQSINCNHNTNDKETSYKA